MRQFCQKLDSLLDGTRDPQTSIFVANVFAVNTRPALLSASNLLWYWSFSLWATAQRMYNCKINFRYKQSKHTTMYLLVYTYQCTHCIWPRVWGAGSCHILKIGYVLNTIHNFDALQRIKRHNLHFLPCDPDISSATFSWCFLTTWRKNNFLDTKSWKCHFET